MKITPKVDDARFKSKLNQQLREQPRQVQIALGRTAEFLLGMIRKRTQKGKDADGNNFKPYSTTPYFFNVGSKNKPAYQTFDGGYKEFRRFKGRQVNQPDLNFSGQMLSNMTQKSSPKEAILFFANKFQNLKAVGNQKKRPFFLIGDKEQKTLIDFFAKELFKQNKLRWVIEKI